MIAQAVQLDKLLLENGDVIRISVKDGLVLVSGEVVFPNAIAYDPKLDLQDYSKLAGDYSQSADTSPIIIAHRDAGSNEAIGRSWDFMGFNSGVEATVKPGDEILIQPKVATKSIEATWGYHPDRLSDRDRGENHSGPVTSV